MFMGCADDLRVPRSGPFRTARHFAVPDRASTPPAAAPRRALIVEDDPDFSAHLVSVLAGLAPPWETLQCATARHALEHLGCTEPDFDLALVDLGLPDHDGLQLIRLLRKHLPALPILVSSTMSSETRLLETIRAGVQGYLLKDGSPQAIEQAIHEVLRGHYPISPQLARYLFRLAGAPAPRGDAPQIPLSPRQSEVLKQLSLGKSYLEVAAELGVSLSSVQSHIRGLYRKLGVRSQVQAVNRARDVGLI
jgi:DNA-binding NarL/FixJ family response regulator